MSTRLNPFEVRVDLSYSTYLMPAKDAAIIASILANATRVNKDYDSAISGYKYENYTSDSSPMEIGVLSTNVQATISMQLDTPKG